MLRIGFSNKYFTLWNIETRTEWQTIGGFNFPYEKTYFHYLKNLSMDKQEALKKAVLEGVSDLEVDEELYGRNSSWEKKRELFSRIPSDKSFFFDFGKYCDQKISEVNDESYLFWYFQQTRNVHCRRRLLDEFNYKDYKGELVTSDHFEILERRRKVKDEIRRTGKAIGIAVSNLSSEGGVGRIEIEDEIQFHFCFPEFKLQSYKGYEYGLPLQEGKGKRIKGQLLELEISVPEDESFFQFKVESFKIIKQQKIY